MGFLDYFKTENTVFIDNTSATTPNPILTDVWDGEKTPGELGAVYDTLPDHLKLRLRAYDMNLKTDIIKIITGKFFKWVVGPGLKLQAEPNAEVLKMYGITENLEVFQQQTEALFNLYGSSSYSDYTGTTNLHQKGDDMFQTAFLGGDALCVIRFGKHGPNMQIIDGQHVESPLDEGDEKRTIIKGIELDKKGKHVAYWVRSSDELNPHKRIKAYNSNGIKVAWMVYGSKARIDHHRGIPAISSILEKVAKLDRFVEASVSKAEQTANVLYAFKHSDNSTGENILTASLSSKKTPGTSESDYEKSGRTANMLRQSTSNQVLNLVPGGDLISLSSENETTFNEFFRAVFTTLCAAVDIPEEVALQKYEQNYSSSRAAINGWEYIVDIYRKKFMSRDFYEPFYRAWLEFNILNGTIKSNGFLKAKRDDNAMALESYFNARFTGKKMPHIDPLKEAKAVRVMLGDNETPLISNEQASEMLNAGEWSENFKKHKNELKNEPKENKDNIE